MAMMAVVKGDTKRSHWAKSRTKIRAVQTKMKEEKFQQFCAANLPDAYPNSGQLTSFLDRFALCDMSRCGRVDAKPSLDFYDGYEC